MPALSAGGLLAAALRTSYVEFHITGSEEGRTQQWVRPIRHRRPRQRQARAFVDCCSGAVADRSGSDGQVAALATMQKPTQPGHSKLSVVGSTGPKEAIGASQVALCLGTHVRRGSRPGSSFPPRIARP